jgi:hypothetical protein
MIRQFPDISSVDSDGNVFEGFDGTVALPVLVPSGETPNVPTEIHGNPIKVETEPSSDSAGAPGSGPGGTNPIYAIDIPNLNEGGVFKASSAPDAGDGYGYVAAYDPDTETYGEHIPCVASVAPDHDPSEDGGRSRFLLTPVDEALNPTTWPMVTAGYIVPLINTGLPAVVDYY